MLVLTRRVNEAIVVGGNIVITVNHISGQRVRLGVEAPVCIPVARSEVAARQPHFDKHTTLCDDPILEAAFG